MNDTMRAVTVGGDDVSSATFANDRPLVVVAGLNVLESRELAMETADAWCNATARIGASYVFKASFDKANRTNADAYRGPGIDKGLQWLADVRAQYRVPVVTDVHEPWQADAVAAVCDMLQLPAFLARQTDLVAALAQTGKPLHVKKPQFVSPRAALRIVAKCMAFGATQVILCERGTSFGYDNLVVDMLGIDTIRADGCPITFDATHALQLPGAGQDGASSGRGDQCQTLARAACAVGIAGLFVESHPRPADAKCDGASAVPLATIDRLLTAVAAVDAAVKPQRGQVF